MIQSRHLFLRPNDSIVTDFFAKAGAFIIANIQTLGIAPDDVHGIAGAIYTYNKSLPPMIRGRNGLFHKRDFPSLEAIKIRLGRSIGQYSFVGIRDTVDTHLVPLALRRKDLWDKILEMHINGEMDYECLSIIGKRLINMGVVVERYGGEFPGTWEVARDIFRRAYGILLGDIRDADGAPVKSEEVEVGKQRASVEPRSSPAPLAASPKPAASPFVDPAVLIAVPAKVVTPYQPAVLPGTRSLWSTEPRGHSPLSVGSSSPFLISEPSLEAPDDDVDEQGFRDSVALIADLVIGDDDLVPGPGIVEEEPEAEADNEEDGDVLEDDLELEAREFLKASGGVHDEDDDLSTIADEENTASTGHVIEWVMSAGVPFTQPAKAEPTFEIDGRPVPSFSEMLVASPEQRLAAFHLCAGAPMDFSRGPQAPPVLSAVCLALRHLILHPRLTGKLEALDIQALLAQAVVLALRSQNYRGRPATSATPSEIPLTTRSVQIGNIFLRTMMAISMVNDACCRPLADGLKTWTFFDGIMWQRRRLAGAQAAQRGLQPSDSMLDRPFEISVFRACWKATSKGTPFEPHGQSGFQADQRRGAPLVRGGRGAYVPPSRSGFHQQGSGMLAPTSAYSGGNRRGGYEGSGFNGSTTPSGIPLSMAPPVAIYTRVEAVKEPSRPPSQIQAHVPIALPPKQARVPVPTATSTAAATLASGLVVQKTKPASPSPIVGQPAKPKRERNPRTKPAETTLDKLQSTLETVKATIERQKASVPQPSGTLRGRGGRAANGRSEPSGQNNTTQVADVPRDSKARAPQSSSGRGRGGARSSITPAPGETDNREVIDEVCPHFARGSCERGIECPLAHVAGIQKPVRKVAG